jgi:2-polyprenyl-6-methoxyphenol hydroxylase-like FAD-dependent oxidoreductase
MSNPQRVLVVGGGIAGLATARALLRRGVELDVVERGDSWSHPGAGVYLPANAVRALGALGLHDRFLDSACQITRQRFQDRRGRVLLEVDLPAVWGATGPCAAISHSDLHELLREGIPVRHGTTVTALEEEGPRVHTVFDDGSGGDYDLVVGADGVRSWVRTVVFRGARPRFLAQASWRFIVDDIGEISAWTVQLGRKRAFLMIPLGRGRIYCYADLDAPAAFDPAAGDPARLAELYGEFAEPVPTIVHELLDTGSSPHFSPIQEVVQTPWVSGRVVLVGDAAHAMSPNMAEGVGMALEDAIVLAQTMAAERPLHDYEARRRHRVRFVQTQTHRRDRTRNLTSLVRDASLRIAGQRIFRSNYHALLREP